jgi:hypothetical protein
MSLRPELRAPVVDSTRLEELCAEIDRITELLESGEDAEADIAAFNALTGHGYTASDFWHYWEHWSVTEFAWEAARPMPPRVDDITRDELVEIVRLARLTDADDADYYLALFEANVIHPGARDLVYRDLDAELIVDEILSHRPIAL